MISQSKEYQAVIEVWKKVLNVSEVKDEDSFFDLGGNSLQAVIMLEMIKQDLGVELSIQDIYVHETLEQFAALTGAKTEKYELSVEGHADTYIVDQQEYLKNKFVRECFEQYNANRKHPITGIYRMLNFQKYFIRMGDVNYLAILSTSVHVRNVSGEEQILKALNKFVMEQEVLRTGIIENGKDMAVYDGSNWNIPILRKADHENDWEEIMVGISQARNAVELFGRGGLLSKVLVLKFSETEYEIRVYAHHCIWDRMSHLIVTERLRNLIGNEDNDNDIFLYSDFVKSHRPGLQNRLRFYDGVLKRFIGHFFGYARAIRNTHSYSVTVCWKPQPEYLQKFKENAILMNACLYYTCLNHTIRFDKKLPMVVLTSGRNQENANSLGMWMNTVPIIYDHKNNTVVTSDNSSSLSEEENKALVFEMIPLWFFRFMAHYLPVMNYVGLFPDYQDAKSEYVEIVDLSDGVSAASRISVIGENMSENRLTTFISGEYIHCTMKVYARSEADLKQMIDSVFGSTDIKGGCGY